MEIRTTSDSPKWSKVSILDSEIENGLQPILKKYTEFPFDLVLCFRCLEKDSGWKSKSRYSKEDNYNALGFDIVVYEEDFIPIKKDIDAQRKSMNPTKYAIDMDSRSTTNLSTGAGAFWDLGTDQNLENARPSVGMLEPNMSYSDALKTSLDRIKTAGYEQVDMPNVTLETMQGAMTSGKSLKAIYWGLLVRCKEKMKMWGPCLMQLVDILIQGSLVYQECTKKYIDSALMPVAYEISVEQNSPLSEDELEERNMDLAEVQAQTMSKKAYMIKWRGLTDTEAAEEINQIALERQMLEDAAFLEDGLI